MRLDDRGLVDPYRPIAVEVALFHASVLQRDRAVQGSGQTEERAPFHLSSDRVRIDHMAAIDGAEDAMDLDRSIRRDLDLGHPCEVTAKGELDRDAAAAP